jgi:ketol-acid reductoisomerase
MQELLAGVQEGTFAREWINENQAERPSYTQLREAEQSHRIEEVGARLRELFDWEAEAEAAESQEVRADD